MTNAIHVQLDWVEGEKGFWVPKQDVTICGVLFDVYMRPAVQGYDNPFELVSVPGVPFLGVLVTKAIPPRTTQGHPESFTEPWS